MNRIILADDQTIFRAGVARLLAQQDDMRIVAQCEDAERLSAAVAAHRAAIVLVPSSLLPEPALLLAQVKAASSVAILITGRHEVLTDHVAALAMGSFNRGVTGPELIECIRQVARGQRSYPRANVSAMPAQDAVGARVRDRLTPKEMQIVALIVEGCKNKEIALRLGTKEQVIKNYLRSIYDKSGVSDRLELALFTLHHKLLAEAAAQAGRLLQMRTA